MKIIPCGIRGTAVAADDACREFGGDTTCFVVRGASGELLVIDAGTGVRGANRILQEWAGAPSLLLLMTHYHLDHVIGFPLLSILHRPEWTLAIAAPDHGGFRAEEVMPRLFDPPFWPFQLKDARASVRFSTLPPRHAPAGTPHGGLSLRWCAVHHPSGCTAYRIDEPATGAAAVVATDFEWAESTAAERDDLVGLCAKPRPADVVFLDGQFTAADYPASRKWGHSRGSDAVEIARLAGVRRLRVIHHAPGAADARLRGVEHELQRSMPEAALARQDAAVEIPGL
jgi:phosphoribosyl 1,2-cyclic phosphodiesterase